MFFILNVVAVLLVVPRFTRFNVGEPPNKAYLYAPIIADAPAVAPDLMENVSDAFTLA